jgi:hypothetical protein
MSEPETMFPEATVHDAPEPDEMMVRPYKRDCIATINEKGPVSDLPDPPIDWVSAGLTGEPEDEEPEGPNPVFNPFPLNDLKMPPGPKWIWRNYVAHGAVSVFCAASKCGKTTLLGHVWRAMIDGGVVFSDVSKGNVLIISEECDRDMCERRDFLKLGANIIIDRTYLMELPTMERFRDLLVNILKYEQKHGVFDMIVFDTLSATLPIEDENNSTEVTRVVTLTKKLCKVGSAVVIIHHDRKSGGAHGTALRGSTALPGQVEFVVEVKWPGEDVATHDRRLTVHSRSSIDKGFEDITISLSDDRQTYTMGARQGTRKELIMDILAFENSMTLKQVLEAWPSGSIKKPTRRTLASDLESLISKGSLQSHGMGTKTDPTQYFIPRKDVLLPASPDGVDSQGGDD